MNIIAAGHEKKLPARAAYAIAPITLRYAPS